MATCPDCGGSGKISLKYLPEHDDGDDHQLECARCRGTGKLGCLGSLAEPIWELIAGLLSGGEPRP